MLQLVGRLFKSHVVCTRSSESPLHLNTTVLNVTRHEVTMHREGGGGGWVSVNSKIKTNKMEWGEKRVTVITERPSPSSQNGALAAAKWRPTAEQSLNFDP